MRVQNLRDFPQTKVDSEISAPFLLNELGDARFFVLVFAKNSLIKNMFEEGTREKASPSSLLKVPINSFDTGVQCVHCSAKTLALH